ncbi:hypothetical protein K7432_000233 [Basidiobolus ranarum]|uniref:Phosphoribulokinase/uridine kinase domain-containing protein n=1 Tax=Basidiobolus ranarum TaxID=34480 RepID=A0ABR2WBL0_9FUNG
MAYIGGMIEIPKLLVFLRTLLFLLNLIPMCTSPIILAEYLKEKVSSLSNSSRYIVSVAGIPGSGKTTLCDEVRKHCGTDDVLVIPMDGFHLTRKQLDDLPNPIEAHERRGAEWTFDGQGLIELVRNLRDKPQGIFHAPTFDHALKDPIQDDLVVLPRFVFPSPFV